MRELTISRSCSRCVSIFNNMNMKLLLILGLWISNSIIGCQAKPSPQDSNSDFRPNFAVEYGAPLITPLMEDVTLELGSNYTLRCEANETIEWKTHGNHEAEVKDFNTLDPERPYGSVLYLSDIAIKHVGSYYCIKSSSLKKSIKTMTYDELAQLEEELIELANNNQASTIYIYVNDPENLLVPIDFPVVSAKQYEDTIIPCKPTMPSVEVLLTTPNDEVYSSTSAGRYDPRRGFVVEIRNIRDSGDYTCLPKYPSRNNEDEATVFSVDFVGNENIDLLQSANLITTTTTKTTTTAPTTTTRRQPQRRSSELAISTKSTVTNIVMNVTNRTDLTFGDANVNGVDVGNGEGVNGNKLANDHNATSSEVPNDDQMPTTTDDGFQYDDDDDDDEYAPTTTTITMPALRHSSTAGLHSLKKRVAPTTQSRYYPNTPTPKTKYVKKPTIKSESRGHVYEGETFKLTCILEAAPDVRFSVQWTTPSAVDENRLEEGKSVFSNYTATHSIGSADLIVKNAQKSDSGVFRCTVTDHSGNHAHNTYLMTVLSKNESYINISEPNNYYTIKESANKMIQMSVKYRGFPWPTLQWYKPDGSLLSNTQKYMINTTETTTTLKINSAQLVDSGQYLIRAKNGIITKELRFNVSVSDKPIASVHDVYVQEGEEAHITCTVLSYPTAVVSWVFTPCSISPRWPSCDKKFEQDFNSSRNARPGESSIEYIHDLYFTPTRPGSIGCIATNRIGSGTGRGHVLIGDITDNMTVYGVDESKKIARGDEVIITCAALAYYFSDDLYWYKEGEVVTESDDIEISTFNSDYSYKKFLKFKSIQDRDRGSYECRVRDVVNHDKKESKFISIFVHEPAAPEMVSTNLNLSSKINRKLGETLQLECKSEAIPRANVNWYKDDIKLNANDNIAIEEDNTKLLIPFMKPEDEGVYKCVVSNRLGAVESSVTVKITDMPGLKLGWILGIIFFFIVLIFLVIYLCVRVYCERKLLRELKAAGLSNFEEGAVEHINPALALDEQADLLPYDRCFEFPRDKLKLGKQLGAGAFGVVLKAHAEGIKLDEKESVVAVKMVKRTADNEVMRALVSELKIMVHLGQHLNVVNLLGAVTKNIVKRELMVIVEYCRYGNVQNFLLRNRKRFINQIHPETDKIDPSITTQRFSDNFELNRDGLKYVNLSFSNHQYINHMNNVNNNYTVNNRRNTDNDPRAGTRSGRPNSSGYLRHSDLYEGHVDSCATEQTVMTTIPEDEDNILSNNSVQPAWRSNYKPDTTEAMTVTTSDLVSWAFQVARGMDYLSSKKVLHGDLAARNILLCEDNIVKICDFGLARSMYKSDNYKKQGEAPLPIKWLALESLSDHVFSTYTDVWSFGIVMWEFFSLAKVPYPGMDPNQSLYMKLRDGYRMEKPPFANDELYDIMLECWSTNAESRPLFHVLEKKFARLLGDEVTNHYVDLNEPYLRINTEYLRRSETDYLALMGSPDELAPPPPRYVNGLILPEIRIDPSSDEYLQVSTNTGTAIFSPTRPKENEITTDEPTSTSFTFPDSAAPSRQQHSPTLANNLDSPANKNRQKEGIKPEEIPMLHNTQHHDSDSDQSPEQARKFANILQQARPTPTPSPRHHMAETQLAGDNDDNYVNVKSPKKPPLHNNGGRVPDAFSNPSYQMLKTVNERSDK